MRVHRWFLWWWPWEDLTVGRVQWPTRECPHAPPFEGGKSIRTMLSDMDRNFHDERARREGISRAEAKARNWADAYGIKREVVRG